MTNLYLDKKKIVIVHGQWRTEAGSPASILVGQTLWARILAAIVALGGTGPEIIDNSLNASRFG